MSSTSHVRRSTRRRHEPPRPARDHAPLARRLVGEHARLDRRAPARGPRGGARRLVRRVRSAVARGRAPARGAARGRPRAPPRGRASPRPGRAPAARAYHRRRAPARRPHAHVEGGLRRPARGAARARAGGDPPAARARLLRLLGAGEERALRGARAARGALLRPDRHPHGPRDRGAPGTADRTPGAVRERAERGAGRAPARGGAVARGGARASPPRAGGRRGGGARSPDADQGIRPPRRGPARGRRRRARRAPGADRRRPGARGARGAGRRARRRRTADRHRRGGRRDAVARRGGRRRRALAQRGHGARDRRGDGARGARRRRRGRRDPVRHRRRRVRAPGPARGPGGARPRPRRARARRSAPRAARRRGRPPRRGVRACRRGPEAVRGVRGARAGEGTAVVTGTTRARRPRPGLRRALAAPLAMLVACVASPAAGAAYERLPAVLHVHSDLTTGDFALGELQTMAEKAGVGALLLTENYLLRIEYGLPPFRALTRVVREERSVLDLGVDRYLERVAEAQARNPRVLLVPGVEVMPHYHWTGAPWRLDMELHDTQKNILVFGVTDAAALRALPVASNPGAGAFGAAAAVDL